MTDRFPPLADQEELDRAHPAVLVAHVICAAIGFLGGVAFTALVIF
jgi:hypothetical protein